MDEKIDTQEETRSSASLFYADGELRLIPYSIIAKHMIEYLLTFTVDKK
ncbi:MAG: hypothetical protein IKH87_09635 [Firmicutes bacterium]|nr:hypothetical protein [Bacillota bacterium]MBR4143308.1 hypothetical protein [Bacillota bacterium]MBR6970967.1 hypothetical protein [Bacillota bacterium]